MQFLLFIVFIFQISHATNNEYLDPSDEAGNAELWKNLFIKLNKVLSEIEILQQGLDDITKRQNDMDARLIKLTETLNGVPMEMSKSKNDLENQITTKLEDIRLGLCEATQSQWTTILRRQDGSVNFYRKWMEYKNGFGNPDGDFFIGLEMLHILTNGNRSQELLVVLTDYDGETRYAKYDLFRVGNESEQYAIVELGTYSGDAGDGMGWHRGKKFSTLDRDNNSGKKRTCPQDFQGAWWFHDPCYSGHLHGPYRKQAQSKTWGVSWHPWRGWDYSLKYAAMMIRPKLYKSK